MKGLAVGRTVHYVLESGRSQGEHRPATVVRDWSNPVYPDSDGMIQLQVFTDGTNDGFENTVIGVQSDGVSVLLHWSANIIWRTSVHYDENKEPGTWHWPERVE